MLRLVRHDSGRGPVSPDDNDEPRTPAAPPHGRASLPLPRLLLAGAGAVIAIFGLAITISAVAMLLTVVPAGAAADGGEALTSVPFQVTVVDPSAAPENAAAMRTAPVDGAAADAKVQAFAGGTVDSLGQAAASAATSAPDVRIHALSAEPLTPAAPASPAAEPAPVPGAAATPEPAAQALPAVEVEAVAAAPEPSPEPAAAGRKISGVNITFYDCASQGFCGNMANGRRVYEGAAACSYDLPLGTRFYIEGDPTKRIYRCEDRGLLVNTWVDIFWYHQLDGWRWQEAVGRYGTIVIVEWGHD
jgi:hypothetical protein